MLTNGAAQQGATGIEGARGARKSKIKKRPVVTAIVKSSSAKGQGELIEAGQEREETEESTGSLGRGEPQWGHFRNRDDGIGVNFFSFGEKGGDEGSTRRIEPRLNRKGRRQMDQRDQSNSLLKRKGAGGMWKGI